MTPDYQDPPFWRPVPVRVLPNVTGGAQWQVQRAGHAPHQRLFDSRELAEAWCDGANMMLLRDQPDENPMHKAVAATWAGLEERVAQLERAADMLQKAAKIRQWRVSELEKAAELHGYRIGQLERSVQVGHPW